MTTFIAVAFILAALIAAVLIGLGWVSDTRQPGHRWYPAGDRGHGRRD